MHYRQNLRFRQLALFLVAIISLGVGAVSAQSREYRIVGYYNFYNIYYDYFVTDIPADRLTHLNYAYIDISEAGQCVSADEWADTQYLYPGDLTSERLRGNFKQLQVLRGDNPNLRVLMTVGGWERSRHFSDVAVTEEARERFAQSCVAFMQEYGFDGIDIDWRYPVVGGAPDTVTRPEDRENLTLLLETLRTAIDEASAEDEQRYLLTMVAPAVESLWSNFEIERVHPYVDWINLTTFGFEGEWSTSAAHMAPLYASDRDPRGDMRETQNVDYAVNAYLNAGVPASKLVIGIPFYGQAWRNVRPNNLFGLYGEADGVPDGTRDAGTLYYRDLELFLQSSDYTRYFDDVSLAPWMYNRERGIAISYENPESITNKAAYVRSLGLGGMMAYELSYDSSSNTLLNAIYGELNLP